MQEISIHIHSKRRVETIKGGIDEQKSEAKRYDTYRGCCSPEH